jgi:hypothetical protein
MKRMIGSDAGALLGSSGGVLAGEAAAVPEAARWPLRELMDDRLLERSRDQAGGLRLTGEGPMLGELVRDLTLPGLFLLVSWRGGPADGRVLPRLGPRAAANSVRLRSPLPCRSANLACGPSSDARTGLSSGCEPVTVGSSVLRQRAVSILMGRCAGPGRRQSSRHSRVTGGGPGRCPPGPAQVTGPAGGVSGARALGRR